MQGTLSITINLIKKKLTIPMDCFIVIYKQIYFVIHLAIICIILT